MVDRYDDAFPHLRFDRPAAGVLRITIDGPGLNAVDRHVTASSPTCGSRSTATPRSTWRCCRGRARRSRRAAASSCSTR